MRNILFHHPSSENEIRLVPEYGCIVQYIPVEIRHQSRSSPIVQ